MEESITFEAIGVYGHEVFDVLTKIGRSYLCAGRSSRCVQTFHSADIDAAVAAAKLHAQQQAQPAEMVAGELACFEHDTLTDRFALALVQGWAAKNGIATGYPDHVAQNIWKTASALAAARPPQ